MPIRPVVLAILDGWGIAPPSAGNAISRADTPALDALFRDYPSTRLVATGQAVGLAENQASGSEAGHMNIGAGRIVPQETRAITVAIYDSTFFQNPVLRKACAHVRERGTALHLLGLLSTSDSPHSDPRHLTALLTLAKREGIADVFLHLFTDGRDSSPKGGYRFLKELLGTLEKLRVGKVASIAGRYWGMDRVGRWDRTARAYEAIAHGVGETVSDPLAAVLEQYERGITDEYAVPTVLHTPLKTPVGLVKKGDVVIFFNFRAERAVQLSRMFLANDGAPIHRVTSKIPDLHFVSLTDYGPEVPSAIAFESPKLEGTLPTAACGLRQLYIAEAEKFAHVTYFFAGRDHAIVPGTEQLQLPSAKVRTYEEKPEMESIRVTDMILERLGKGANDLIVVNYPNADILGHTGNIYLAMKGVEIINECVDRLAKSILTHRGALIVTADHGNAEEMIDFGTGEALTNHSRNPVPFLLVMEKPPTLKDEGLLANIAPTALEILGVEKPGQMIEQSLIRAPL